MKSAFCVFFGFLPCFSIGTGNALSVPSRFDEERGHVVLETRTEDSNADGSSRFQSGSSELSQHMQIFGTHSTEIENKKRGHPVAFQAGVELGLYIQNSYPIDAKEESTLETERRRMEANELRLDEGESVTSYDSEAQLKQSESPENNLIQEENEDLDEARENTDLSGPDEFMDLIEPEELDHENVPKEFEDLPMPEEDENLSEPIEIEDLTKVEDKESIEPEANMPDATDAPSGSLPAANTMEQRESKIDANATASPFVGNPEVDKTNSPTQETGVLNDYKSSAPSVFPINDAKMTRWPTFSPSVDASLELPTKGNGESDVAIPVGSNQNQDSSRPTENRDFKWPREPNEQYEAPDYDPIIDGDKENLGNEEPSTEDPFKRAEVQAHAIIEDKNAVVVATVLSVTGFVFMVFIARQMIENPDGCCASICRCMIGCLRLLCWPCRAVCGCGNRAKARRTHNLIVNDNNSYGYSHDLELT